MNKGSVGEEFDARGRLTPKKVKEEGEIIDHSGKIGFLKDGRINSSKKA